MQAATVLLGLVTTGTLVAINTIELKDQDRISSAISMTPPYRLTNPGVYDKTQILTGSGAVGSDNTSQSARTRQHIITT